MTLARERIAARLRAKHRQKVDQAKIANDMKVQRSSLIAPLSNSGIQVHRFHFVPSRVIVTKGATVTWSVVPMSLLCGSNPSHRIVILGHSNGPRTSSEIQVGETFECVFDEVGDFEFYCSNFAFMSGTVSVIEPENGDTRENANMDIDHLVQELVSQERVGKVNKRVTTRVVAAAVDIPKTKQKQKSLKKKQPSQPSQGKKPFKRESSSELSVNEVFERKQCDNDSFDEEDVGMTLPPKSPLKSDDLSVSTSLCSRDDKTSNLVHRVVISPYMIEPSQIDVGQGDTIVWQVSKDADCEFSLECKSGSWTSGVLSAGQSFSRVFNTQGTFSYGCPIYSWMKATVSVQASSPLASPSVDTFSANKVLEDVDDGLGTWVDARPRRRNKRPEEKKNVFH